MANIADINTTEETRTITLTVSFKPNEDRTMCPIVVKCKSTLAGDKPFATALFLTEGPGRKPEAYEYNPEQLRLDTGNVMPMQPVNYKKGDDK